MMKSKAKRIAPYTAIVAIMLSLAPIAAASTLTVSLNPTSQLAQVHSVSDTKIVLTYPAGSMISKALDNLSSSKTFTNIFSGGSQGATELQGSFDDDGSHVSVRNMSVTFSDTTTGNATTLVIEKTTNITSWVTGVFEVVNGSVTANLGWRSFVVRGEMRLPFQSHTMDVNLVGSVVEDSTSVRADAASFLVGMFAGGNLWDRPTLNFSALDSPLSTWTKNYDAATNTTTFSKTISGQSNFTASADFDGKVYTLSVVSDPSGVVAVQGYANASGDSLVMSQAPASMTVDYLAIAGTVALVAAVGYAFLKSKSKAKQTVESATSSLQV